jgi:hypothetical protein
LPHLRPAKSKHSAFVLFEFSAPESLWHVAELAVWRRRSPKVVLYQQLKFLFLLGVEIPRDAICAAKCAAELGGFSCL